MAHAVPSQYLPILLPLPPLAKISAALSKLTDAFAPSDVIDLRGEELEHEDAEKFDEFELQCARGWLGRVVSLAMKEMGSEFDTERMAVWEGIVDSCSSLLASISGHCAAGASTKTYLLHTPDPVLCRLHPITFLPTPPSSSSNSRAGSPPPQPPISLNIRETTLLSSSTGFRTWGSAPLLAKLLTTSPSIFFPPPTMLPRLRVLELGSGTGLVGFAASATLKALGFADALIHLSDWESTVLENLSFNLEANKSILLPTTEVHHLDWSSFTSSPPPLIEQNNRYDVILGADVIYEPSHLPWIYATVSSLLDFPDSSSPSIVDPTFYLIIPLRETLTYEHDNFELFFSKGATVGGHWKLVTKERKELLGNDGFGRGRQAASARHWFYRIGWEKIELDT